MNDFAVLCGIILAFIGLAVWLLALVQGSQR